MNAINEQSQIIYELDSEGLFILNKLSKWNKIIGILFIFMGITTLLTIFIDYTNPISVFISILLSVFVVYLGTRLTSAASHFKYSLYQEDSESLKIGMNNLRQYFMITGISYVAIMLFMIVAMIVGSFFGLGVDGLSEY
ncbi:MAG: DUF5362 family protein [Candidatus Neomarinimicrobiota bacterium]